MAPRTTLASLAAEQASMRQEQTDTRQRVDQIRRIFGLNGKVQDPELEGDLAEGFKELRLIARARRESQSVNEAKATLKAHYAAQVPGWAKRLWKAAHSKIIWLVGGLGGALLWVIGYNLGNWVVGQIHHMRLAFPAGI